MWSQAGDFTLFHIAGSIMKRCVKFEVTKKTVQPLLEFGINAYSDGSLLISFQMQKQTQANVMSNFLTVVQYPCEIVCENYIHTSNLSKNDACRLLMILFSLKKDSLGEGSTDMFQSASSLIISVLKPIKEEIGQLPSNFQLLSSEFELKLSEALVEKQTFKPKSHEKVLEYDRFGFVVNPHFEYESFKYASYERSRPQFLNFGKVANRSEIKLEGLKPIARQEEAILKELQQNLDCLSSTRQKKTKKLNFH